MSKKMMPSSKKSEARMADVTSTMQDFVRKASLPCSPGERTFSQIARAARRLGFTHSRTHDLWYGNARRIDAQEYIAAREYVERKGFLREATNAAEESELIARQKLIAAAKALSVENLRRVFSGDVCVADEPRGKSGGSLDF